MLLLIGFNCRECRVNRVSRQSAIEAGINDLNDRINKLTASIKPGTNATNTSTMAVESNGAGSTGRQRGAGGGNGTGGAGQQEGSGGASSAGQQGGAVGGNGERAEDTRMTRAQVVTLVSRTVGDKERRKKNVIITGLPENSPEEDSRAFGNLCEQYLSTKPALSRLGTKRLGKVNAKSDKPRRLLVHLDSESAASEILRSARQLREADDPYVAANIFINADLSIADQKIAYERRQHRRQRDSDPTATPVTGSSAAHTTVDTSVPQGSNMVPCPEQQPTSTALYQTNHPHYTQPGPRPGTNPWQTPPTPFYSKDPPQLQSAPNQIQPHAFTTNPPMYHMTNSQHNTHSLPVPNPATIAHPYHAQPPMYTCPPIMISGSLPGPAATVTYHNHHDQPLTPQPFHIPYPPSQCLPSMQQPITN